MTLAPEGHFLPTFLTLDHSLPRSLFTGNSDLARENSDLARGNSDLAWAENDLGLERNDLGSGQGW